MNPKKVAPVLFEGQCGSRLEGISESATLKLNATVQLLKSQGEDVVNLTAGEPDFPVHDKAKEAIIEALKKNQSKYTPVPGIPDLRKAIAEKTNKQQPQIPSAWESSNVVVSNGGKQAIFNALLALLDEGDEVLVPAPYWLSYPEMIRIAGGTCKVLQTTQEVGFKITPDQLRLAINDKTKVLILNSPSNPTGAMYSKREYEAIARVLKEHPRGKKIWVLSDEIYDRIVIGSQPFVSFLEAAPELQQQTVTLNGMSKSAAMTGWRVGWSVAQADLTKSLITLQGQSTSGINALAQWASVAALRLPESEFDHQIKQYQQRCNLMLEILGKSPKIKVRAAEGAFYLFVGIGDFLKDKEDALSLAQRVLEDAKVAVVPGNPFGAPEYFRLSFATDLESIRKGCKRLVDYLNRNE